MEPLVLFHIQLRVSPVCYSTSDAAVSFLKDKKKTTDFRNLPRYMANNIAILQNCHGKLVECVVFFHLNQEFIPITGNHTSL